MRSLSGRGRRQKLNLSVWTVPEFDGHQVDFDLLMNRLRTFDELGLEAMKIFKDEKENPKLYKESVFRWQVIKMQIPRQSMKEQPPAERVGNFLEVPYGYEPETAVLEAQRCLQCKSSPCIKGCPVGIDIPGFIDLIANGKFIEAAWKIKETNSLPAICGRVCPQEEQCEMLCVRGKAGEPVAIGRLERFAADFETQFGQY